MKLTQYESYTFEDISKLAFNPYRGILTPRGKNYIVLISSINGLYNDKWDYPNKIIHYTGEGQKGDQDPFSGGNKAILEHEENNKSIYLFEKPEKNKYIFMGEFYLVDYYFSTQPDSERVDRRVVIFKLKLIDYYNLKPFNETTIQEQEKSQEERAKTLKHKDKMNFEKRANLGSEHPGKKEVIITRIDRDPYVKEAVKDRANGNCELCEMPAPFKTNSGDPYLEVHHIVSLQKDGPDTVYNTIALCPNCHKEVHYSEDLQKSKIYNKLVSRILNELITDDDLIQKAKTLLQK